MGKSMFNFGKQGKERARQQKQMDKAAKRLIAKQQKANLKAGAPNADPAVAEPRVPLQHGLTDRHRSLRPRFHRAIRMEAAQKSKGSAVRKERRNT